MSDFSVVATIVSNLLHQCVDVDNIEYALCCAQSSSHALDIVILPDTLPLFELLLADRSLLRRAWISDNDVIDFIIGLDAQLKLSAGGSIQ